MHLQAEIEKHGDAQNQKKKGNLPINIIWEEKKKSLKSILKKSSKLQLQAKYHESLFFSSAA